MKYYTVLIMALTSLALTGFLHRLRSRLSRWNVLTNVQKVVLVSFISLTVILPIITLATLTGPRLASRAETPVTPPVTPPTTPTPMPGENQISWITNTVSLRADDFRLTASGGEYLDNTPDVTVHSDPGNLQYTTLEVTWTERNVEMRLYMYFHANQNQWWASEIRTYNGNASGDWIYYTGPFFTTPLGQSFSGNIVLNSDPDQTIKGTIRFDKLYLQAFINVPGPSPRPNAIPVITTTGLPSGILNRQYTAVISGYDQDERDTLSFTTSGLPTGLRQDKCTLSVVLGNTTISCILTGRPLQAGIYPITITLQDNRGGITDKVLPLRIVRTFRTR